jgi:hypothetical protein
VVQDLAEAPDVIDVWLQLSMPQRREVIDTLVTVRILPVGKGENKRRRGQFDPDRVEIIWKTS